MACVHLSASSGRSEVSQGGRDPRPVAAATVRDGSPNLSTSLRRDGGGDETGLLDHVSTPPTATSSITTVAAIADNLYPPRGTTPQLSRLSTNLGQVRALLDNFDGDALGMWRTAGRMRSA